MSRLDSLLGLANAWLERGNLLPRLHLEATSHHDLPRELILVLHHPQVGVLVGGTGGHLNRLRNAARPYRVLARRHRCVVLLPDGKSTRGVFSKGHFSRVVFIDQ